MLEDHLSLEENTLWGSTVGLLWFVDHNCMVFEVVAHDELSYSVVFKPAFNNALFEIAIESKNLYNKI